MINAIKATPGPMQIEHRKNFSMYGNTLVVLNEARVPIAFVPAWDNPLPGEEYAADEAMANACLIAASSDLLSALKECALQIGQIHNRRLTSNEKEALENAREVIAKAEGQK